MRKNAKDVFFIIKSRNVTGTRRELERSQKLTYPGFEKRNQWREGTEKAKQMRAAKDCGKGFAEKKEKA